MSVKEDKVNLTVTVNGDSARQQLANLRTEADGLKREMKGVNKESDEYKAKAARLKEVEDGMKTISSSIDLNRKTMKELNEELRGLNKIRQNLEPGTAAFRE